MSEKLDAAKLLRELADRIEREDVVWQLGLEYGYIDAFSDDMAMALIPDDTRTLTVKYREKSK
jgi:hypothetical protein